MILAVIAVVVLLLIFGPTIKNMIAAGGGILTILLVGGVGIALLGTAIAFPPFAIVIVIFLVIRGLLSKDSSS